MSRVLVIGIAGGTGSGKTTVAKHVMKNFEYDNVVLLHHDSYYLDRSHLTIGEREILNYDHPSAFENSLLLKHLSALRRGLPVETPTYDYASHTRLKETRRIESPRICLLEGILVLEDSSIRELMDIRIFIDTDADIRFIRRLRRDVQERNRTPESVMKQYLEVVRPMHLQFVEPSKRHAHVVIPEGGHNRVAIDLIVTKIKDILAAGDNSG
ncbi:MAG: uridine kinase [Candidatus Eisenbacteria sp.]|nr:uridine kinase [Candidatus Eisenbacteria bacterium]